MRQPNTLATLVVGMLVFALASAIIHREDAQPVEVLIPSETPKLVILEEQEETVDVNEFACMQANLFFEARNESERGMEAVALVTLTRVAKADKTKLFDDSVCGTVQKWVYNKRGKRVCQFSWYCDGKDDMPNLANAMERKAWERAGKIARMALKGKVGDFLGQATHYHAVYVSPDWSRDPRYKRIGQVGKHIFYRDTWFT